MKNIHIIFGSQGAGKSTYSIKLSKEISGVHLSIDEWMSGLYSADLPKPINFNWIMTRVERCERIIWATATKIVKSGGTVILDLGFLKKASRSKFLELAKELNLSVQLHYVNASYQTRLDRVISRNSKKGETFSFEVTPDMFNYMEKEFESPTDKELKSAIIIDSSIATQHA